MTDIVERLRGAYSTVFERSLAKEAADALEAKDKEIERLRRECVQAVAEEGQRVAKLCDAMVRAAEERAERAEAALAELKRSADLGVVVGKDMGHSMNCPGLMDEYDCTCGLRYRIVAQTERELHNAWMKRATEAEAERDALRRQISEHNEGCQSACMARTGPHNCGYKRDSDNLPKYEGRRCPECPLNYIIDAATEGK